MFICSMSTNERNTAPPGTFLMGCCSFTMWLVHYWRLWACYTNNNCWREKEWPWSPRKNIFR